MTDQARTGASLTALQNSLRSLSDWADDRLNEDFDRQYIAEHMTEAIDALLSGEPMPPRPF
ncbi:hypothetical protein COUCH_01720 [Couchioplanes caeruleus]|uniref:hypothetical protein n=1 Tax=Couchioplanes caeruleus TaxID=56438 RepID=UPI0020BD8198|nr:hypothetical protein [Couchioplanes caeruleus]UQU65100.1 hypothetical protein COUCH_01720 [Couchioplanes caeruleus]